MFNDILSAFEVTSLYGVTAWLDNDDLVVELELPGYEKGKISVFKEGDCLTIDAQKESIKRKYICNNSRYPEHYQKSLLLPDGLDQDKTEAVYNDGVLTIKMKRAEDKLSRQITVK